MKAGWLSRSFALLWLGQGISQLGSGVGTIATMWWIQSTTGSALTLATLAVIKTSVAVLIGPFAGVVVDRLSRKTIIVGTDLVRGAVFIAFAFHAHQGSLTLPMLFVGSAVSSACAQFFTPAIGATIPLLVPRQGLQQANSLRQVTDQLSSVFSYGLGGILVAVCGVPLLFLIDGLSFLIAAGSRAFIVVRQVRSRTKLTVKVVFDDLRQSVAFAKADQCLYHLLGVVVMLSFSSVPFCLLLPLLVEKQLGAGSEVYGYINSAQMAGMVLGTVAILLADAPRRYPWLLKWGIGLQATAFMLTPYLSGPVWGLQLLTYAVFGFFQSIINISFFTALQREVPQELIGKVYALVNTANSAAQPVASGLSGYLADTVGLTAVFVGAGILAIISNLRLLAIPGALGFLSGSDQTGKAGLAAS